MKRSSGMIESLALIALTVTVAAGGLALLTHRQDKKLTPGQQVYAYRMPEPDAKRLVQAAQQLVRGDAADRVTELLGKPNHTVANRSGSTSEASIIIQDHYYVINSGGPIIPYEPNPNDTCVIVGIGPDKKIAYVRMNNITGAIRGLRSNNY